MRLTIVTLVGKNKGPFLDKFLWGANRYASTHRILVVLCPKHAAGNDEYLEHLRDKYKSLEIQYHHTQVESPELEDLPTLVGAELDTNKSIYLDLEKPAF